MPTAKKKTTKSNNNSKSPTKSKEVKQPANVMSLDELNAQAAVLPPELKKKFEKAKPNIEKFKVKALEKFEEYIMSVAYLPPIKDEKGNVDDSKTHILVLVDDSDSKKMSKFELKDKLSKILETMGTEIDKTFVVETLILSEVWQSLYDQKFEIVNMMTLAVPVFDKGVISALKISEIHKRMVIKKFEKYIVSYCIAGAFTKGRITSESDIDVFVVIDDTDVKKMTRAELKDKLRAIIISMGYDAKQMTGVNREFHIQVYILTDFWESLKEAHPVIFDLLRDGVPLYDRGIFMPWKQLLKMGKIRPSEEAIEMFMNSGEQIQKRIKFKLREIAMEDIFLSIQTPSQAALMAYGLPPPAPKETPKIMEDIFVKKEKILEKKYVDILSEVIKTRKDIEHGKIKEISGAQIDALLIKAEDYLKRINTLFKEIDEHQDIASITNLYDRAVTVCRDAILLEKVDSVKDEDLAKVFKKVLIDTGKIPQSDFTTLKHIFKAKKDFESSKLKKNDIIKIKKEFNTFIKNVVEFMQRRRARELDRSKIRVKYGHQFGEVILLGKTAYIVHDIDADEREVSKANLAEDGSISKPKASSLDDLEEELSKNMVFEKVIIKGKLFESLSKFFGKEVEILMN